MTDAIGKNIGQYQIIEFISRGENSFVYKGFQPGMSRYVAVKILPPSLAREANAIRQFQRQAELMAQLQHRNILPIYDSGQEGALSYVVSRFSEGGTLQENIGRYQQPIDSYQIVGPVCEALDYIHGQGLVHGNLRPNNILIDDEGQPLLTGIGALQAGAKVSQGSVYFSPEQGQGGILDSRSDIYALGVLLYEMLIGQPPEIGKVPSPRIARPELSTSIEKVILKAMAHYPEQRFRTAGEFHEAYKEALELSEQPVPLQAPVAVETVEEEPLPEVIEYPAPESDREQDDRWIFIALGGLFLVVILCGVMAATLFLLVRDREQEAASTPMATAKVDTNVFAGPSPTNSILGVLQQGQSARILGVSPDGIWWNVAFPSVGEGNGWVPDAAVVTQNVGNVPVIAPTASVPDASPSAVVPTQDPPTLVPTLIPPSLEPPTLPATDLPPTLEPLPTEGPSEPYPPIVTTEPPTPYPPALTEVVPTSTMEVILSATSPVITPTIVTEPPPSPPTEPPPMATQVTDNGDGNSLCGLPALVPFLLLFGIVLPFKRFRSRR